jgi:hypothetical protein
MSTSGKKMESLSFSSNRKFGIEIEINAFDKRNRPENSSESPTGTDKVVKVVQKHTIKPVQKRPYEHSKGDAAYWSVKPDSSCGMEVVSPALSGWSGLLEACQVVYGLQEDRQIEADYRCSVHVHIETKDLNDTQLATVLAYWVKSEMVFMDAMPPERKANRYCQPLSRIGKFEHDLMPTPQTLIQELGDVKYYSLNTNQMMKARADGRERPTIEFRIGEAKGAKDAYMVKNWIRLLIHFVEMTSQMPYPLNYKKGVAPLGNSLCILDPHDVFQILGFGSKPFKYDLSNGLKQTRNWFLARILKYIEPASQKGMPRNVAFSEIKEIITNIEEKEGIKFDSLIELNPPDRSLRIFHTDFRY